MVKIEIKNILNVPQIIKIPELVSWNLIAYLLRKGL